MSLYEDEDLGGPPAVSSWSRGKYDLFLCLTDFQQNKYPVIPILTTIYFIIKQFRCPIDAVTNAT